jgi:hypothetical protein
MRKIITFAAFIAMLTSLVGCNYDPNEIRREFHAEGDFPVYRDVDALFDRADLVVRVEVLDNGVYEMRNTVTELPDPIPEDMREHFESGILTEDMFTPDYQAHTVYQVRVIETFGGNAREGEIIEVLQRGGVISGTRYTTNAQIPFAEGDDLVLFLIRDSGSGSAGLLTPWQAVYRFTPENNTAMSAETMNDESRVLEIVDERNCITLTVGDLRMEREDFRQSES